MTFAFQHFRRKLILMVTFILYCWFIINFFPLFFFDYSSPTYQLASKSKKSDKNELKEAPLADPEPTSDISNQNAPLAVSATNTINGNVSKADVERPTAKALHNIQSTNTNGRCPIFFYDLQSLSLQQNYNFMIQNSYYFFSPF